MVETQVDIDRAIASGDDLHAISVMETMSSKGVLAVEDEITLALMLMMPPLADCDGALSHLRLALKSAVEFEAAAWGVYIVDTLYPVTSEFYHVIQGYGNHPVAQYLIASHCARNSEIHEARELMRGVDENSAFPNLLLLASRLTFDASESARLRQLAQNRIRDCQAEHSPRPANRSQIRTQYWSELIRGDCLSSEVWDHHFGGRNHQ